MLPAEAWEEGWQCRPEACLRLHGPSSVKGPLRAPGSGGCGRRYWPGSKAREWITGVGFLELTRECGRIPTFLAHCRCSAVLNDLSPDFLSTASNGRREENCLGGSGP